MRALLVLLLVGCTGVVRPPAVDSGPELGDAVPIADAAPEQDAGTDAATDVDAAVLDVDAAVQDVDASADDAGELEDAYAPDSAPGAFVDRSTICAVTYTAYAATHCPDSGYVCPLQNPGGVFQYQLDRCEAAIQQYYDNPAIVGAGAQPCPAVHYLLVRGSTPCNP